MNHYTTLLDKLVSVAEADSLVNTITDGFFTEMDWQKVTDFPLVHIQLNGGLFSSEQTIRINVQIGCYNKRNATNLPIIKTGKRLQYNDNRNDNMNECLNILNRIWLDLVRDFKDDNITASQNPSFDPDQELAINTLDGYVLTFDVELPNTTISLCEPL